MRRVESLSVGKACTAIIVAYHRLEIGNIGRFLYSSASQQGAANAEIKVPSGENTELKRCPF